MSRVLRDSVPTFASSASRVAPIRMVPRNSTLRRYAEALAIALFAALVLRSFFVQAFKIQSGSMLPTLQVGDHLLVFKLAYGVRLPLVGGWLATWRRPRPFDVVVFSRPQEAGQDFVKRVVAVAGEVVEIRDKRLLVGGAPRDAPQAYFAEGTQGVADAGRRDNFGPKVVPPGQVFVLGDNRDRSYDSRFWGFVDVDDIKGQALIIYWSWDARVRWVRWERLWDVVH
jgi:signal peptidase I